MKYDGKDARGWARRVQNVYDGYAPDYNSRRDQLDLDKTAPILAPLVRAASESEALRQEVAKLEAKLAVANSWAEGMAAKADKLEAQAKASMDGVVLRRLRSVTSEQGMTTHQRWMRMDEILRAHSAGGE